MTDRRLIEYSMPEPREVLLLHPIGPSGARSTATLLFAPSAAGEHVRIRLVGVPVDGLLDGTVERWWPLDRSGNLDEPVLAQSA